ncbi:MAG: porin [Sphingomonadaceae bacterium]|nr:porin [Sphingomonadaceae bacterium]
MISCAAKSALATLITVASAVPAVAAASDDPQSVASLPPATEAPPKKTEAKSEWQLKPRWRVQYDVAEIDGPAGLAGTGDFEDIRRARIGVDLKMPRGFAARVEAELTTDPIELTDAYLQWSNDRFKVIAGQQKAQLPLDEENSNLNISFLERAAFVSTFGYGRRTGISGHFNKGDWSIAGGVYTDPLILLNDVGTNSTSVDVRTFWSPKVGKTKLHFAAAYHWRDLNDFGTALTRYRSRPSIRIVDTRYIGTPGLAVDKEQRYGIEAAAVNGRFHFASEAHWLRAHRAVLDDPTFFGAYAEAGVFLTNDSRPLKGGVFGAIKPKKPVGGGGIGAVQLNVRYDYLDLNSKGVTGGKQNGFLASLIWTPAENFRLMGQYSKLKYSDAAIGVAGDRSYTVDVVGVRGQISY